MNDVTTFIEGFDIFVNNYLKMHTTLPLGYVVKSYLVLRPQDIIRYFLLLTE